MKKRKELILVAILVAILVGSVVFLILYMQSMNAADSGRTKTVDASGIQTFADWTDVEMYRNIPALIGEETKIGDAVDYGDKNYVLDVNGTELSDYQEYVTLLQKAGFSKHSDNGEDGMEGYIYTSNFTKDDVTLTVSHAVNLNKTYISATTNLALSDHLTYDQDDVKGISADSKTKVHMLELNNNGACFIVQLKNGHFVLHDGGGPNDAPYLLDYLEELTPGDEKPVIEGWFISHVHADHDGAIRAIIGKEQYYERIIVDGVYLTRPSDEVFAATEDLAMQAWIVINGTSVFTNSEGGKATFYRPALGQRYYFCDLSVDVTFTPEQIPTKAYYNKDFNDTSIWLMNHIEDQRFLIVGDAGESGIRQVMIMYDEAYFDMDIYAVSHHGINVYDYFTEYCTITTALYPNWRVGSLWQDDSKRTDLTRIPENMNLQDSVEECYSFENGTIVLTFPYKVGTVEVMKPCDWRYNFGTRQQTQFK